MAYRFNYDMLADLGIDNPDFGVETSVFPSSSFLPPTVFAEIGLDFDNLAGDGPGFYFNTVEDAAHESSCCCADCDGDSDRDSLDTDAIVYIDYGLNGFTSPWLDFGAITGGDHHGHDHDTKDVDGRVDGGATDTIPDDNTTTEVILVGGRGEGVRNSGTDEDWFQIDLVAGQEYTFFMLRDTVNGVDPHQDPWLYLYSTDVSGNTQLASNDDTPSGGQNSRITFTATETGTHYLGASGYQTGTGGYTILAEESDQRADFTNAEIANFLTDQFSPRAYWDQGTITYNMTAIPDGTGGTDDVQNLIILALEAWAEVTGLIFTPTAGTADLTFIDNQSGAYSSSQYGTNVAGDRIITSSTINVSQSQWIDAYGDEVNSYSYQTYLHEIGHSLGLGHGGPYNGSSTYGIDNAFRQDTWNHTVMSYHSQGESGFGTSRLSVHAWREHGLWRQYDRGRLHL